MTETKLWTGCALAGLLLVGCGGEVTPMMDAGGEEDAGMMDAGPPPPPECPTGTEMCGESCVATDHDRSHCGGCDLACDPGEACIDGACDLVCPASQTECDGACADTMTDRMNCGACGTACASGEQCVLGDCALGCPDGQMLCGTACVNVSQDPAHCGDCATVCDPGEVCSAGGCALVCGTGLTDCSGACVDTDDDPAHCGACDGLCTAPAGASGLCASGTCQSVCDALMGDCNGDLRRTTTDGCETPLATDAANCGACGRVCTIPNAVAGCDAGACVLASCDTGFEDCDGTSGNGCEVDVTSSDLHCGGCNIGCGASERCFQGDCVPVAGENCSSAITLVPGANRVVWTATTADYLLADTTCNTLDMQGPDVVLTYTATVDERVTLSFGNATSTRWVGVVATEACGTIPAAPLGCASSTAANMSTSFLLTAGQTIYVYVRDTGTTGTTPLTNPLNITLTNVACTSPPPVTLDPPNGTTTDGLGVTFTARFGAPIVNTVGTVTITGDMGTSLSYALSALPPEITFSTDSTSMEIDPGISFPPGEHLTISWTGLRSLVCTAQIDVPAPTWTLTMPTPPCAPGANGLVGSTITRIPTGLTALSEYYVAPDESATGYVYFGGSTSLYRIPKAGGTYENVETLAGMVDAQLGYAMLIDGQNIYTLDDRDNGPSGRLWRISSDGGATWQVEDYAVFPNSPLDDFAALTAYGGRIYLVTEEISTGVPTQVWSVDAAATALPTLATLEFSIATEGDCSAIARDASFFYLSCENGGGRIVRIPAAGGAPVLVTDALLVSATKNSLYGDDTDGDGVFDVLYVQSDREEAHYVCNLSGTVHTDRLVGFGNGTGNYGLGFDRTANALWMFDDDTFELVSIR